MEKKIIVDAVSGDPKAIERIIIEYQNRIYGFVRSKVTNPMDVDEIVQDTLIACFINISKLRKIETLSSWIFTLCSNKIKNYYRQKRIEIEFDDTLNHDQAIKHEWEHYKDLIKVAIASLNENQRDVMHLRYFCNHSYSEISVVCNISLQKVKSRLFEAKKILKSIIPNLYHSIEISKNSILMNKERVMNELEMIRLASQVIRSLSLEDQMELCFVICNGGKIEGRLLKNIGTIDNGKEFLKACNSRLTVTDLSRIITYDKALDKWLIENMEQREPELTENLKKNLFIFEDIVLLGPDSIRAVLAKTDSETFIQAISSTEKIIKQYLLSFYPNKDELFELFASLPTM